MDGGIYAGWLGCEQGDRRMSNIPTAPAFYMNVLLMRWTARPFAARLLTIVVDGPVC